MSSVTDYDEVSWSSDSLFCGDFIYLKKEDEKYREAAIAAYRKNTNDAIELMYAHFEFYGYLKDEQYVTRGSVIACSSGTDYKRLSILEDHGIYTENGDAVMTCNQCKVNQNIYSFGICNTRDGALPRTEEITLYVWNNGCAPYPIHGQRCIPLPT